MQTSTSRRDFLKKAALAGAALSVPASSYARILGANERVGLGMIGIGQQSRGHLFSLVNTFRNASQVIGLCDVYQTNLDFAKRIAPGIDSYTDFRKVLDRKDVDAVVIGTPDHWHAVQTVMACQAGKDVYVEKPTSVRVAEGRAMVEAARKHNRIVQVGTQQRSGDHFQKAVEFIRSGKLGKVSFVRAWNYGNSFPDGWGSPPDSAPVPGLDWDMWLGPAPKRPFNINRFGVVLDDQQRYQRWATFRYFWDYAGGMMTDWGVHHLDIIQWAIGHDYPTKVSAVGGKFHIKDNRDTPDTLSVTYEYPDCVVTYENRDLNSHPMHDMGYGMMYHGTAGTLFLDREKFEVMPEAGKGLEPMIVKSGNDQGDAHKRDFFEAIKSRKAPIADIEVGHRSTTTAVLGNVSYLTGRSILWDGKAEKVIGDEEANRLLLPQGRDAWVV